MIACGGEEKRVVVTDHVYVLPAAPSQHQEQARLFQRPKRRNRDCHTTNAMASPLSPLSDVRLNTKSPAPMPLFDAKSTVSPPGQATHVHGNGDESEINWDEGPSSPFISHVQDDGEHHIPDMPSIASPLPLSTAVEKVVLQDVDATPSPARSQTGTPFNILEDDTCTFHSVRSTASASHSVVASPSKALSQHSSTRSVREEETTVTTHFKQEFQTRGHIRPKDADVLEAMNTTIDDDDDANIDDTCFSTFSQVPNTDMTTFARLGQSPIKQPVFDQVSGSDLKN